MDHFPIDETYAFTFNLLIIFGGFGESVSCYVRTLMVLEHSCKLGFVYLVFGVTV